MSTSICGIRVNYGPPIGAAHSSQRRKREAEAAKKRKQAGVTKPSKRYGRTSHKLSTTDSRSLRTSSYYDPKSAAREVTQRARTAQTLRGLSYGNDYRNCGGYLGVPSSSSGYQVTPDGGFSMSRPTPEFVGNTPC